MESYDNIIFNSEYEKNNNINNITKDETTYEKNSISNNANNNNIPITEQPFFNKIISFLLKNNKYLPSKALLLFYKNFKMRSFNNISLEELINILS